MATLNLTTNQIKRLMVNPDLMNQTLNALRNGLPPPAAAIAMDPTLSQYVPYGQTPPPNQVPIPEGPVPNLPVNNDPMILNYDPRNQNMLPTPTPNLNVQWVPDITKATGPTGPLSPDEQKQILSLDNPNGPFPGLTQDLLNQAQNNPTLAQQLRDRLAITNTQKTMGGFNPSLPVTDTNPLPAPPPFTQPQSAPSPTDTRLPGLMAPPSIVNTNQVAPPFSLSGAATSPDQYKGGSVPITPDTPKISNTLPYPGENDAITKDPNQQAIINQEQLQANLINSVIKQLPTLISQQQQAQQQQAQQAIGQSQQLYNQGQSNLQDLLNKRRQFAEQQLTTGPEGEAMREDFNRLGLLNSGAFNKELANQFGNIEQQSELATGALSLQGLQDQQNILDKLYGTQSGLDITGLNRLFGLQDTGTQTVNDLGTSSLSRLFGNQDFGTQQALAASIAAQQRQAQQNQGLGGLFGMVGGGILGNMFAPGLGGVLGGAGLGDVLGSTLGSLF